MGRLTEAEGSIRKGLYRETIEQLLKNVIGPGVKSAVPKVTCAPRELAEASTTSGPPPSKKKSLKMVTIKQAPFESKTLWLISR